jgi:hypothetical protein
MPISISTMTRATGKEAMVFLTVILQVITMAVADAVELPGATNREKMPILMLGQEEREEIHVQLKVITQSLYPESGEPQSPAPHPREPKSNVPRFQPLEIDLRNLQSKVEAPIFLNRSQRNGSKPYVNYPNELFKDRKLSSVSHLYAPSVI